MQFRVKAKMLANFTFAIRKTKNDTQTHLVGDVELLAVGQSIDFVYCRILSAHHTIHYAFSHLM